MVVRKSIRSARPRTRSDGRRARTHSVRPAAGKRAISESLRLQHIFSDEGCCCRR
jgi:hypothetical protein